MQRFTTFFMAFSLEGPTLIGIKKLNEKKLWIREPVTQSNVSINRELIQGDLNQVQLRGVEYIVGSGQQFRFFAPVILMSRDILD